MRVCVCVWPLTANNAALLLPLFIIHKKGQGSWQSAPGWGAAKGLCCSRLRLMAAQQNRWKRVCVWDREGRLRGRGERGVSQNNESAVCIRSFFALRSPTLLLSWALSLIVSLSPSLTLCVRFALTLNAFLMAASGLPRSKESFVVVLPAYTHTHTHAYTTVTDTHTHTQIVSQGATLTFFIWQREPKRACVGDTERHWQLR